MQHFLPSRFMKPPKIHDNGSFHKGYYSFRCSYRMLCFAGDIEDEDEVLSWLTDENTLEIPGKIEEVNSKMLEKILEENDHVVVFFCKLIRYKK